ncbi:MAG: hypothetical protein RIB45_13930 [Marivibrio sp.]|uniref:hypothetical protein n=1 Tax=Marivibrio sp. TaxID=2039719 RepID=UPI0032EE80EB
MDERQFPFLGLKELAPHMSAHVSVPLRGNRAASKRRGKVVGDRLTRDTKSCTALGPVGRERFAGFAVVRRWLFGAVAMWRFALRQNLF